MGKQGTENEKTGKQQNMRYRRRMDGSTAAQRHQRTRFCNDCNCGGSAPPLPALDSRAPRGCVWARVCVCECACEPPAIPKTFFFRSLPLGNLPAPTLLLAPAPDPALLPALLSFPPLLIPPPTPGPPAPVSEPAREASEDAEERAAVAEGPAPGLRVCFQAVPLMTSQMGAGAAGTRSWLRDGADASAMGPEVVENVDGSDAGAEAPNAGAVAWAKDDDDENARARGVGVRSASRVRLYAHVLRRQSALAQSERAARVGGSAA